MAKLAMSIIEPAPYCRQLSAREMVLIFRLRYPSTMTTSLRWTSKDLEGLSGDDKRYEIIDGTVCVQTTSLLPPACLPDWRARSVEVYRREGQQLRLTTTLYDEDPLETSLLPGFSVKVAELFAGIT
jgi:hypothetical protein